MNDNITRIRPDLTPDHCWVEIPYKPLPPEELLNFVENLHSKLYPDDYTSAEKMLLNSCLKLVREHLKSYPWPDALPIPEL